MILISQDNCESQTRSQTWQPPTEGLIHSRCSIHVFPSTYLSLFLSPCNSITETSTSDYCQSSNASRWPRCKPPPALEQVIYSSFICLFSISSSVGHLEPLGTNEKMKALLSLLLWCHEVSLWEHLREERGYKEKRNLPGTKLCCLGPPSLDFKDTFS